MIQLSKKIVGYLINQRSDETDAAHKKRIPNVRFRPDGLALVSWTPGNGLIIAPEVEHGQEKTLQR
ncbi:MAG: hypothetical protein JSV45_02300, partial [Chromatiales bacterium]